MRIDGHYVKYSQRTDYSYCPVLAKEILDSKVVAAFTKKFSLNNIGQGNSQAGRHWTKRNDTLSGELSQTQATAGVGRK